MEQQWAALMPPVAPSREGMPYRQLGRTGEAVSLLGLGGQHIGLRWVSERLSIAMMRRAVDEGVNFFDNSASYNGGQSEERMGRALKDGYRDRVFLMTKHRGRDAKTAREILEQSLRRLQVDVIDLWQFHAVVEADEPARIYDNGALEVALEAKEQGKIRYIGFTGHALPSIHLEMITRGFPWDVIQMPINLFDYHYRSFQNAVLPQARAQDIGVVAMKVMGGTPGVIPFTKVFTPEECLHYTMSLPISTVLSGMDSMDRLTQNIASAKRFAPLDAQALEALRQRASELGPGGSCEPYKRFWLGDLLRFFVTNTGRRTLQRLGFTGRGTSN